MSHGASRLPRYRAEKYWKKKRASSRQKQKLLIWTKTIASHSATYSMMPRTGDYCACQLSMGKYDRSISVLIVTMSQRGGQSVIMCRFPKLYWAWPLDRLFHRALTVRLMYTLTRYWQVVFVFACWFAYFILLFLFSALLWEVSECGSGVYVFPSLRHHVTSY